MANTPDQNVDQPAAAQEAVVETTTAADVVTPETPPVLTGIEAELEKLPEYSRRLLQILVPVRVTLASQRKSIQEIIELGPGSIVKFDKTCDEPFDLCGGARPVAQGEVVKVGDKFGLKISGLVK
jgi:flagellar motor switch/type III secretory pathway protein FliN